MAFQRRAAAPTRGPSAAQPRRRGAVRMGRNVARPAAVRWARAAARTRAVRLRVANVAIRRPMAAARPLRSAATADAARNSRPFENGGDGDLWS